MKRKMVIVIGFFLLFLLYATITNVVTQVKIDEELKLIEKSFTKRLSPKGQELQINFQNPPKVILNKHFNKPYPNDVYYTNPDYIKGLNLIYVFIQKNASFLKSAPIIAQTLKQNYTFIAQELRLRFLLLTKNNTDLLSNQNQNIIANFHIAIQQDILRGITFYQSDIPQKKITEKFNPFIGYLYKLIGVQNRDFIYYLTSMKNCEEIFAIYLKDKDFKTFVTHTKHFDSFLLRSAKLTLPINQIRQIYPLIKKIIQLRKNSPIKTKDLSRKSYISH